MAVAENVREVEFAPVFEGELDELLDLGLDELADLYERATVPEIESLDGDLRGRMLASALLPGVLERPIARWAASRFFVWRGKSFKPLAPTVGRGINRVGIDRFKLYPFITRIRPSRAGEFDAMELDYDLPENPFFIRAIKDELRELRPGLWLGRAYLDVGRDPTFALFFALASE